MSSGLDAVRDALAEVKTGGGFQPRRVALAPVAPLPPPSAPAPVAGDQEPPAPPKGAGPAAGTVAGPEADAGEGARLPGTAKGHRRLLAVNLPAATRQRLDAARGDPPVRTRADVVLEALAATFEHIAGERRPQLDAPQSRFSASRVRRRRLALDDPRDVPIQFSPGEAAAVKEAADEVGLTVSALITDALDRQLRQPAGSADR
jgi:hypothetical protein